MPTPTNKKLYEEVKEEIYKKYPKHSAYRSGLLVQEYKRRGGTYEGNEKKTNRRLEPLVFRKMVESARGNRA